MRHAKKLMNTSARAQQCGRADMACRLRDEKNGRDLMTEHLNQIWSTFTSCGSSVLRAATQRPFLAELR